MQNALGTVDVPLTTFGGAVVEMEPSDLPEGASPGSMDVDFIPGAVFTRGGRQNEIYFNNSFVENLAGRGQSLPGSWAPNETAWSNPNNITVNTPGVYAAVTLSDSGGSVPASGPSTKYGPVATFGVPVSLPFTPLHVGDYMIAAMQFNAGSILPAISDTRGNVWTPVVVTSSFGCWVARANSVLTTTISVSGAGAATDAAMYVYGVSVPSSFSFLSTSHSGNSANADGSIGLLTPATLTIAAGAVPWQAAVVAISGTPSNIVFAFVGTNSAVLADQGGSTAGWGTLNGSGNPGELLQVWQYTAGGNPFGSGFKWSQVLQADTFAFNIPTSASIQGFQIEIFGHQSVVPGKNLRLTCNLIKQSPTSPTFTFQLPAGDGLVAIATPITNWGLALTPATFNDPNFGAQIVAYLGGGGGGSTGTFSIYAVKVKVWVNFTPANFDWIKTYEQTSGQVDTLALDSNGILWDENVTAQPGALNSIFTAISPNTFAKGVTFQNTEYIALSNLLAGTDMPRQWNGGGQWLDRVSQVGPGAPPAFATTASGSSIVSIKQNAAIALPVGSHDFLLVSASPSAHGTFGTPSTPGNVMTIVPRAAFVAPLNADGTPQITVGSNIQISGFPSINGNAVNNDPAGITNPAYYTVTSVGQPIPGQQSYDWITFQVPFTTFYNQPTPGGCQIQATIATMTTSQQVPFLEVGNQFTLTGVAPSGWNNTFVVQKTPNASQLNITQTSLTGNVATYVFTLITGTAPVVGQFVTVTGTLNGNGAFNIVNGVITAATPTQFSVAIQSPNINPAPETNVNGIISGTIFVFDPVGVVTNPIIGNAAAGGTIATSGVLGIGIRMGVVMFKTRNNGITGCSPPIQFNVGATATAIVGTQVPIGPPNTIARILAFTGAGGANYFYIATPQTVLSNGQNVTYSSTVINDNTSTQVTLSFPDALLLASTAIDVTGRNNFEQIELGSCRGFLTYSDRLIAWGEQNKIQNMLNLSFDGGIGTRNPNQSTLPNVLTYPLGWTVDPVNGGGGQINVSPLFGNSYYVRNVTGGTQALYGMIEQSAFQDAFQVPIVFTGKQYSVRVSARCPSGVVTGALVMDLFSPKLNQSFGSFTVPLSSMTSNFALFSGAMLTTPFTVVPKDLLFRVYGTNIPNNGDFELDRVEPFPTFEPTFSTQFRASYAFNQEAFDLVTGGFGPAQNQQPINGGMVLFDALYALKERSIYSTSDNGVTEPNFWNWREISNKVGTIGIHSYDSGAGWAFTADRNGLWFFNGGEPIKCSQEIQPVWDLINWAFGHTIWVRNDEVNKRVTIGVPMATPNAFLPEFPINANPISPNVVLAMSYRELNEGIAIAANPGIKSTFSGKLISPEPARKWSWWNIACPYADFIDRATNQWPLWFCTGYSDSKIFQLIDGTLSDDGLPLNSFYLTYGFVKAEMADAKGLGLHRLIADYLTADIVGSGTLNTYVYPDSPLNTLPIVLDAIPLASFTLGDLELNVNIDGQRFFIRHGTNAVGAAFRLSKIVLSLTKDPWAEVRGVSQGVQ